MAWSSITSSEIAVGQPVDTELLTKIKDSLDYVYTNLTNREGGNAIPNGSFESASSNTPDGWTVELYTGGASTYENASTYVMHGQGAITFIHPGGAGNGGGHIISDYFPVSTGHDNQVIVKYLLKTNASSLVHVAQIEFFDKDKNAISNYAFSTGSGWTTSVTYRQGGVCIPPSSARFARIVLVGCGTAKTETGRMTFDNVYVDNVGACRDFITYDNSTSQSTFTKTSSAWETLATFYIDAPRSNSTYYAQVNFEYGAFVSTLVASIGATNIRFRKGTTYIIPDSNYIFNTSSSTSIDVANLISGTIRTTGGRFTVNAEVCWSSGVQITGKKTSPISALKIIPMNT